VRNTSTSALWIALPSPMVTVPSMGSCEKRAGTNAQILLDSNAFVGVKTPQEFNNTADQGTANITSSNNVYTSTSGGQATGGGGTPFTTPSYSYTADAAATIQAAVQAGAGPR